MVKNALAARDLPQTPLGELTASPDPLAELRKDGKRREGTKEKGKGVIEKGG